MAGLSFKRIRKKRAFTEWNEHFRWSIQMPSPWIPPTSAKSFLYLNLNWTSEEAAVHLPSPSVTAEAWRRLLWHAGWTMVMNSAPCQGSSQGGKWRGYSKLQSHVHGNPSQSQLILTPCLALWVPNLALSHQTESQNGRTEKLKVALLANWGIPQFLCHLRQLVPHYLSCTVRDGARERRTEREPAEVKRKALYNNHSTSLFILSE